MSSARAPGIALLIGALAAFSLPGVRAARAEADLVPPVSELFSWNSRAPEARPAPVDCAARAGYSELAEAQRRAAYAQLAELMRARPGEGEALNGRGYAYPALRDPAQALRMIELEALRQRGRPAGAP
jgi:hypothetical protein